MVLPLCHVKQQHRVCAAAAAAVVQTFKDRLRVPGLVRAGSITVGSDAGSSMRSAPVGGVNNTPTKTGGLWRWATGGRCAYARARMIVTAANSIL